MRTPPLATAHLPRGLRRTSETMCPTPWGREVPGTSSRRRHQNFTARPRLVPPTGRAHRAGAPSAKPPSHLRNHVSDTLGAQGVGHHDEGEGFESVDDWRLAHERFFEQPIEPETQIVALRFRVVERL